MNSHIVCFCCSFLFYRQLFSVLMCAICRQFLSNSCGMSYYLADFVRHVYIVFLHCIFFSSRIFLILFQQHQLLHTYPATPGIFSLQHFSYSHCRRFGRACSVGYSSEWTLNFSFAVCTVFKTTVWCLCWQIRKGFCLVFGLPFIYLIIIVIEI